MPFVFRYHHAATRRHPNFRLVWGVFHVIMQDNSDFDMPFVRGSPRSEAAPFGSYESIFHWRMLLCLPVRVGPWKIPTKVRSQICQILGFSSRHDLRFCPKKLAFGLMERQTHSKKGFSASPPAAPFQKKPPGTNFVWIFAISRASFVMILA